jgi:hypothetical protein
VVPSDRFESDPTSFGASRVEVASKTNIFLICRARLGSSNSSRPLLRVDVEAFGSLESTRWLLKGPKPLAMQIQESKMKVVPLSSMVLVKLNDAIEFYGGCPMNTPTWCASSRCFTATLTEGYPRGGEFVCRVSPRSGI